MKHDGKFSFHVFLLLVSQFASPCWVPAAPPGVKLRRSKSESSLSVVLALVDNYLPTDNPKDSFKDTPSQVSSSLRAASCDIDRPEYLSAPTPGAAAFRPPQLYSSRAHCNPTPPIPPPATQAGAERGEGAGVHGEAGHFRPRYSLNMSEKDRVARQRFIDAQRRHVQATRQWILGQTENAILQETRPEYATLARPHCSLPARHLGVDAFADERCTLSCTIQKVKTNLPASREDVNSSETAHQAQVLLNRYNGAVCRSSCG